MTQEAKRQYLMAIRERYRKSTKKEKKLILDEYTKVCRYSRKYAIRVLTGAAEPRQTKPGPKPVYDVAFDLCLRELWEAMDRICSKKMVQAMRLWLPYFKSRSLTEGVRRKLLTVSAATIDRHLKVHRRDGRRGLSTTRPARLKTTIPIELLEGEVKEPGYVEADTVAHCGDSAAGLFANSLTVTDLCCGWTANRALHGKKADETLAAIKAIEADLPFIMWKFSCDSGSEFINEDLRDYCRKRQGGEIKFVRRRPYKKNDAAHVEQKNWTHVRQLFGYERIEDPATIAVMNEIYKAYWNPLQNYFTPTMKLVRKERVGAKIKKYYDQPKTPCDRLIDHPSVPERVKDQLRKQRAAYNPFTLKEMLDKRLADFVRLVAAEAERRRHDRKAS